MTCVINTGPPAHRNLRVQSVPTGQMINGLLPLKYRRSRITPKKSRSGHGKSIPSKHKLHPSDIVSTTVESNTKSSSKSYQEEANGGLQNSQALGNPPSCSKSGKGSPIPQSVREKDTLTTQQFIMESWPDQTPDIQRASAEQVAHVQGILTNLGYQTRTPPPGFHNPPILSTGNISCTVSQLESGGLLQSPTAGIMQ